MLEPGFIVSFPLYVIVIPPRQVPLTCVAEDDESYRGVALYTEELFAERARDKQAAGASIWMIANADDLKASHLPLYKEWGFKYVAIDPHEETGKGSFVPIEDLD